MAEILIAIGVTAWLFGVSFIMTAVFFAVKGDKHE